MEDRFYPTVPSSSSERSKLRPHVGEILVGMHNCIMNNDVPKLLDLWRWLIASVTHLIPREQRELFRITHDASRNDESEVLEHIFEKWGTLVPILAKHNVYGWPTSDDPIDAWYLALRDDGTEEPEDDAKETGILGY